MLAPGGGAVPVRVVVVDDSVLIREGILRLLELDPEVEVVAVGGSADDALEAVEAESPDVVLMDIRMPPTHTDEGLQLALTLRERNPGLVIEGYSPPWGFESNPEHTADVLARINEFQPDLLFMCTGAPKSEKWVSAHLGDLGNAVAVCAGAAIDFEAGTKRRAPKIVRMVGLEWAFRLVQEPRRLWHRYLVKDAAFFPMALREIRRK